ncbi:hypothetical protein ZWY2020_041835 [Hordeum vulgare]|nr:hypothetical protein ZWY2020_041835 [Hordeum vulgare]
MEPTAGSGSGAAEPVQEPDSNASSTTAAAPPPPPASATPLHREQAGDGADGSSPATVVDPRKGKDPAPPSPPRRSSSGSSISSSTRSHDYVAAFRAFQGAESSAAAAARFRRVTWSDPVVEEKTEEKLSQAKVKSKQDKLPQAKGKLPWSKLKNKIFRKEGREICSEHVKHQTHPITEVRRHYMLASDEANHLDAYSECRSEQVIDRQDTHEERRLLHVVKRVARQHANLRWNSEFSRSSRAFKNLIKKVKRWKRHGRWNSRKSTSSGAFGCHSSSPVHGPCYDAGLGHSALRYPSEWSESEEYIIQISTLEWFGNLFEPRGVIQGRIQLWKNVADINIQTAKNKKNGTTCRGFRLDAALRYMLHLQTGFDSTERIGDVIYRGDNFLQSILSAHLPSYLWMLQLPLEELWKKVGDINRIYKIP